MKATKIKQLFFYTLTTAVAPAGGGSLTVSPLKNSYVNTEPVTLTAVPAVNYEFTGWTGDASGSTNPLKISMTKDKTITANFQGTAPPDEYTLTVNVLPSGSGSVTVNPLKGSYALNEQVTLTAVPGSGNSFVNWSGDASGSTNPLVVTMTSNKTINANFTIPVQEMEVPDGGIILYVGTTAPTGFEKVDGLGFVMTSTSTSVNKTMTSANLTSHPHTYPASGSVANHAHSASAANVSGGGGATYYGGGTDGVAPSHTHTIGISNFSSAGGHSHASGNVGNCDWVQVPFRILNFIKNTSGGLKIAPIGSIVMVGAGVTIPDGWAICDGSNGTQNMRERFAYGTTSNADLLVAGGTKTHTHPAVTTGSAGAHSHTYGLSAGNASGLSGYGHPESAGGANLSKSGHSHTVGTPTTATQAAHTHTYPETDAADHMPPYVYLYYIQRIT